MRMLDTAISMLGMPSPGTPQNIPIILAPQQSLSFVNTARALSFNGSTPFSVVLVANTSYARLVGPYGARTGRTYGDTTTQWTVSLNGNVCSLTWTGTGAAPNFTTMQQGDGLTIEKTSTFNPLNQGDFIITAVGSNYVEFLNPVATGETITDQVDIYSSGPVQVGDTLYVTDAAFNYVNQGQFLITRVTDLYVEFSNPNAIVQAGLTGVTGVAAYSLAYNWMFLAVDQKVIVKINGDTTAAVEVEPPVYGDLSCNPGILLKRGRVYSVTVQNPGLVSVNGFVFLTP